MRIDRLPRGATTLIALVAASAVAAAAAQAEPRELDRGFGNKGIARTPIGTGNASANALARQGNGRVVVAGTANSNAAPFGGVTISRYLPNGTLDSSFGGGDGVVIDQPGVTGDRVDSVLVQPDGKIVVAGRGGIPGSAKVFVARYLSNGARDTAFGDGGARLIEECCDSAGAGGLARQADGKLVVAGFDFSGTGGSPGTSRSIVARLTTGGDLDLDYGTGGVATLSLGDASPTASQAHDVAIQDGKAVIAGTVAHDGDPRRFGFMLARLDEHGVLDPSFGDGGVVFDRPGDAGVWTAEAIAQWNDRLVVAGSEQREGTTDHNYVLARYTADGDIDTTFNPDVPEPGHVSVTTGDGLDAAANGLAVDPATGAATITGYASHAGEQRLLLDRFTSGGVRDPEFVGANGNGGPVVLDAPNTTSTVGNDVVFDNRDGALVAGTATSAGRDQFLLARFGDTAPTPNIAPVARIRGHHTVPRKTRITFRGNRSYDLDGDIVEYAWRVGKGRFHKRGPIFTHRFGRTGTRTVILRVTDDDGAIDVALFRVKIRSRRG